MSQTALVTGASGGIGYEFAKVLASQKYNLVLIARNVDKLFEIKQKFEDDYKVKVMIVPVDLTIPMVSEQLFHELDTKKIQIDVLINNAGIGDYGKFSQTDWKKEDQLIQLNIVSLTHLTKFFMKGMIERGSGRIVNVASTAGFLPGPIMSVYFATKAYVISFSQAIACELKGTGVTVTTLCPGPTESGFQTASYMGDSKIVKVRKMATSEEVAQYGYKAMMRGQSVAIHGKLNNFLVFAAQRILPRSAVVNMVRKQQESKNN